MIPNFKSILISTFFLFGLLNQTLGCSMYKVTQNGKTMVGCNEDAWRTTSKIWFENARIPTEYGAVFTGSRQVHYNRTVPQSGMNEAGLTFSRLTAYYPNQNNPFTGRKKIGDETEYLTDILHQCASVEDVEKHIENYDHSFFIHDVFIYTDSTGKYLIVEPYLLRIGQDQHYLLANFCPSITSTQEARKLERYRNGEDYISNHPIEASLSYCSKLSEVMQVNRKRNQDGTLLTTIWDTKARLVNLFFYHSFDSTVQFNLKEELSKGDYLMDIPPLFPSNPAFERLKNYHTPFNTPSLRITLVFLSGILTLFSLVMIYSAFRYRNSKDHKRALCLFGLMNVILTLYLFLLATHVNLYYFDAPYVHPTSTWISLSSYTPFLLLLLIPLFISFIRKGLTSSQIITFHKFLWSAHLFVYLLLLFGFGYWGLFNIWK